jgi:non-ribosomal peptide synthetase component F
LKFPDVLKNLLPLTLEYAGSLLVAWSLALLTLHSSEALVDFYQTAWHHVPEDSTLHEVFMSCNMCCCAGGAYTPLEVSFPSQLLMSLLEDAKPIAVCTKAPFLERLACSSTLPILLDAGWFDRIQEENSQLSPLEKPIQVSLDDMAYTVYSSGTTGKPKGKV